MTQLIDTAGQALNRRMVKTANRFAGMTREQVLDSMRGCAKAVAEHLQSQNIPANTGRWRPDCGPVQIDMVVIEEKVSKPEPAFRLQFDIEGGMGVTLNIKLLEFVRDPKAYMAELMTQLGPMRRNVQRMRSNKRAINDRMYDALTKGVAHG